MFFRAVTTPLMTPVPNFNKWCAVSNFLFENINFCIFTPKTPLLKENYFLTLWNFTYLKDTSFGKKLCNFELGLETKNEFEKWPLYNFVSVYERGMLVLWGERYCRAQKPEQTLIICSSTAVDGILTIIVFFLGRYDIDRVE